MKIFRWISIIVLCLLAAGAILMLFRGNEDSWIRDDRGVWIKHGNPKDTPDEVTQQQEQIKKAQAIYADAVSKNTSFTNGPCLGTISDDWVLDLVHSHRDPIDDRPGNQCSDFLIGKAHHFIELDLQGDLVRIY